LTHSTRQHQKPQNGPPLSDSRLAVILGIGGSGKTEIALNLARAWARALERVHIVDFDLVTPYFRAQDVRDEMGRIGVRAIAPPPSRRSMDVPFIPPEVPHIIAREDARAIFDVGGDVAGATTVRQFAAPLRAAGAEAYVVVNARRPETADAEAIARATRRLATAAGLDIAGLIANTHLRDETTWDTCLDGLAATQQASAVLGVPVVLLTYPEGLVRGDLPAEGTPPMLPLHLYLALPWAS
jgi:hypothetical protein